MRPSLSLSVTTSTFSQSRERMIPLCSALVSPQPVFAILQCKDVNLSESLQRRSTKVVKGLESKTYEVLGLLKTGKGDTEERTLSKMYLHILT